MNNGIVVALTVIEVYALAYLVGALSYANTHGRTLSPFRPLNVLSEAIGVTLRGVRQKRTFSVRQSPDQLCAFLGLHFATATEQALMAKAVSASVAMKSQPWAYPQSQHQALLELTARALRLIRLREEIRAAGSRKADSARAKQQTGSRGVTPSRTGWRRALGLSAHERDPHVIKKAYRALVSKAHPDRGGNAADMVKLNSALADARKELDFV